MNNETNIEDLIKNLNKVKGVELKYKQLCEQLQLKIKGGDSKKAQLNDLQMYCDIKQLSSPTRYVVTDVFEQAILSLGVLNKNNKFQTLFEAALYQTFLKNNSESLWLSNMDMLKLFQEINENFSYACNIEYMKKMGDKFIYMANMSQIVYRILRQWTRRRLEIMEKRGVVNIKSGYRVYTKHHGKHGDYLIRHNVCDEDMQKNCLGIWNQAVEKELPSDWKGGWVPEWQWFNFEKRIDHLISEKSNGKYCSMKKIFILSPPDTEWLKKRLIAMYEDIEASFKINQEACHKILSTTQLNNTTGDKRQEFIDINMSSQPPFLFKHKLHDIE